MAKPICVIYYEPETVFRNSEKPMYEVNELFREMLPDYHTLAVPSAMSRDGSCEVLRLQVFHEKDFTEIQYAELKQLIEDSIKQNQP